MWTNQNRDKQNLYFIFSNHGADLHFYTRRARYAHRTGRWLDLSKGIRDPVTRRLTPAMESMLRMKSNRRSSPCASPISGGPRRTKYQSERCTREFKYMLITSSPAIQTQCEINVCLYCDFHAHLIQGRNIMMK